MHKLTLKVLRDYDAKNSESLVRLLELKVEGVLYDAAYTIQFWTDVELYGFDEAILYVENGERASPAGVHKLRLAAEKAWREVFKPYYFLVNSGEKEDADTICAGSLAEVANKLRNKFKGNRIRVWSPSGVQLIDTKFGDQYDLV